MNRPNGRAARGAWTAAAVACAIFAAGFSTLAAPAPRSLAQPRPTATSDSRCTVDASKTAAPSALLLGETVTITFSVRALCPAEAFPLHIDLVLDASGSMSGEPSDMMKDAASEFVRSLDLEHHPDTRVGVVQFNSAATTLCQLTNDAARAIGCIRRVGANGGTAIDAGIRQGLKDLIRARSDTSSSDVREAMVILTDGDNNAGCPPVLAAANATKGQGVLLITVCLAPGCDAACMRPAATSPGYFHRAEAASQLATLFEHIRVQIVGITLRRLNITDVLPDNMRYVPDSADPEPKHISPNSDEIEWELDYVAAAGVTLTLRLEPLQPGRWPANVVAVGEFLDSAGREGRIAFRIPYVTVLDAHPVPTPTFGPSPTVTPAPPTAAPPSATPTATSTPAPRRLWLPKVDRS